MLTNMTELREFVNQVDLDADDAYDRLFRAFSRQFTMPVLTAPIKAGNVLFRSRQNADDSDFAFFCDLSYPPSESVTNYSRANVPGQQLFYASDRFETNLAELLPYWVQGISIGTTFAVTTAAWELTNEIVVAMVPDFNNDRLMEFLRGSSVWESLSREKHYWDYINSFFHDQGVYKRHVYKVSSAFSNALLQNCAAVGWKVQGILFTSAQDTSGWNLALLPQTADTHLKLVSVVKHLIRRNADVNGKPSYDNFQTPIIAFVLDYDKRTIIWA
ncbi:MAG: hypothetical protein FJ045_06500, partial [Crenarchaeota archaeon]|nr:hypothetical protein [Thermoproteota archaeon]